MGLLRWFFRRLKKSEFAELLQELKNTPHKERAVYLICTYLSSSTRLSPDDDQAERLAGLGVDSHTMEKSAIRIFHYAPSNQSLLLYLEGNAIEAGVSTEIMAFRIHRLTNFATTCPAFELQVIALWETLFEAAEIVPSVFNELRRRSPRQKISNSNSNATISTERV